MTTMIRPLHDHVLVRPREAEARTASGLHIPDVARAQARLKDRQAAEADVVAVGNGRVRKNGALHPLGVRPGDRVLYLQRPQFEDLGKRLEARGLGEGLLMLREEDVLAVIVADEDAPPKSHNWDHSGERCLDCGAKDWMDGPCN